MANPEIVDDIDISEIELSTIEIEAAIARGQWSLENEHHAQSVSYDPNIGLIYIKTTKGE